MAPLRSLTALNPPSQNSQVQNAEISRVVIPPNGWAGRTGKNVSQVCEIATPFCAIRWGGITPHTFRAMPRLRETPQIVLASRCRFMREWCCG
jgi:hypothetical protein